MSVNFSIPRELADRLRRRAERNQRSLEDEVIAILEDADHRGEHRPRTLAEINEYARSVGFPRVDEAAEIVREMRETD